MDNEIFFHKRKIFFIRENNFNPPLAYSAQFDMMELN